MSVGFPQLSKSDELVLFLLGIAVSRIEKSINSFAARKAYLSKFLSGLVEVILQDGDMEWQATKAKANRVLPCPLL